MTDLEQLTDLCRELWKHKEVREAWGEWRVGDNGWNDHTGERFTVTQLMLDATGWHGGDEPYMYYETENGERTGVRIKASCIHPIIPLSDPLTPARGLLGMLKDALETKWEGPMSLELILKQVAFYATKHAIPTPETAAATLLLEILEDDPSVEDGWDDGGPVSRQMSKGGY